MQAAHAVVAVTAYVLQMIVGLDDSGPARGIDGECNPSLSLRVCLSANHVVSFEVLGMNHTVAVGVSLLPRESGTSEKRKPNPHVPHIQQSLL